MSESKYELVYTDTFQDQLKKAKKKFPSFIDDFRQLAEDVEKGDFGTDVPGVVSDGNKVFKKRMKNKSANKGSSGGFRFILYLVTESNEVFFLHVYSKSDQEDIQKKEIRRLIQRAGLAKPNA